MTKDEFIRLYNRPEFICIKEDLDNLIENEITLHEIRKMKLAEKELRGIIKKTKEVKIKSLKKKGSKK